MMKLKPRNLEPRLFSYEQILQRQLILYKNTWKEARPSDYHLLLLSNPKRYRRLPKRSMLPEKWERIMTSVGHLFYNKSTNVDK